LDPWEQRRAASGRMLSEEEHVQGIRDGMNSLKDRGMLPSHAEPLSQPGIRFDTGHYVGSVMDSMGRWTTYVSHDDDRHLNRVVQIEHGDLGGQPSRLADHLTGTMRRPEVMQSMREQMQHGDADEPRWIRKYDFS
jgi:hypothetical protein